MSEYSISAKTIEEFWDIWDSEYEKRLSDIQNSMREIRDILNVNLKPEVKKEVMGRINKIYYGFKDLGKIQGEGYLREVEYINNINMLSDERRVFKEIVIDLSKKL